MPEKSRTLPWFRLYAEFITDPSITFLSFEDQRHFVGLLCLKCSGIVDRPMAGERRDALVAHALGLPVPTAREVRSRLVDAGLIERSWQPVAWEKRQFQSDVSTGRVRKHRETVVKRFRNGPDSDSDSDSDSDKKNLTATGSKYEEGAA